MAGLAKPPRSPEEIVEHVAQLEARLARVEAKLGFADLDPSSVAAEEALAALPAPFSTARGVDEDLEQRIGQRAFTLAGVIAVTSGFAFLLSLPHSNLPPPAPAIAGLALSSGLFTIAHALRHRVALLGDYVRGAAMLLLYFATLRLFFFGRQPVFELHSFPARTLLVLATLIDAALAWRSRSRWLVGMALVLAAATALLLDSGALLIGWLPLVATAALLVGWHWKWPGLVLAAIPLTHLTYFLWAVGNPPLHGRMHYMPGQPAAPGMLLAVTGLFAAGCLYRLKRQREDAIGAIAAMLNVALGYGALLVHTAAAYPDYFVPFHVTSFVVFLGLAVPFWSEARAPISTFLYAITGYVALSMAIIKATSSPDVFVWLSVQSVVVLATAIWFQSRLIVVANFLIYAVIVSGYVFFVKRESGISIGFGLVALLSARLLNWQQQRLELKTGLMRNAYLVGAFIVFPYALHHLVPTRWIALTWVALAVAYYALNWMMRNQKYRWMGHGTLGLTAVFLVITSIEPAWRIASFLALGSVLLAIALTLRSARPGANG